MSYSYKARTRAESVHDAPNQALKFNYPVAWSTARKIIPSAVNLNAVFTRSSVIWLLRTPESGRNNHVFLGAGFPAEITLFQRVASSNEPLSDIAVKQKLELLCRRHGGQMPRHALVRKFGAVTDCSCEITSASPHVPVIVEHEGYNRCANMSIGKAGVLRQTQSINVLTK